MQPLATCTFRRGARSLAFAIAIAATCTCQRVCAFDWQVDITPSGELFPALQLSQAPRTNAAAIGDGDGLVSVRVRGTDLPARLHLRIETAGLRTPAVVDAARGANAVRVLHPRLDWDIAALRTLHAPRRQPMRITFDGETREVEVRLHPLDDALYFVREGHDQVDLGWSFAGYVNPLDPVVDEVLALAREIDSDFAADARAYDAATDVHRVGVVWAALEKHGLRYAAGNPALSQGPLVYSQRVRLLGELWRERRANCLDSSVLIASVLERLGIRALIVLVPGHAFIRFDAGADRRDARYLETTLLGVGARTGRNSGAPADAAHPTVAAAHFAAALEAGRAHWRRVASRLDGRHSPDFALIDIETARAYGIIPLTSARGERTAAVPL